MPHWTTPPIISLRVPSSLALQPLRKKKHAVAARLRRRVMAPDKCQSLFPLADAPVELRVLHRLQNVLKARSWLETHVLQVFAGDQAWGPHLLGRRFRQESPDKLIVVQHAVARNAVQS